MWVSATIGVLLVLAFIAHALRTEKPLIDLRLFKNRRLTIATVSMFVFVIAFMGAGLLFPSYFLQVRGETTLMAGLLIAPQGLGAMVVLVGEAQKWIPDLVAKAIVPDYALGAHTAALGLEFYNGKLFPASYQGGAFIGQHGSWNRKPRSGYKVIFVPFANGKPQGRPVDVLTGFLDGKGDAMGRPEHLRLSPTPIELEALGDRFRPYRSVVAWYCWRAVETVTPEGF